MHRRWENSLKRTLWWKVFPLLLWGQREKRRQIIRRSLRPWISSFWNHFFNPLRTISYFWIQKSTSEISDYLRPQPNKAGQYLWFGSMVSFLFFSPHIAEMPLAKAKKIKDQNPGQVRYARQEDNARSIPVLLWHRETGSFTHGAWSAALPRRPRVPSAVPGQMPHLALLTDGRLLPSCNSPALSYTWASTGCPILHPAII